MTRTVRAFMFVAFVISILSIATPAAASPITWLLEGTEFSSGLPGIAVGDPASMLLTFESLTPDSDPSPSCGLYLGANMSMTSMWGSQTFVSTPGLGIEVSDGTGSSISCGIMPGTLAGYTFRAGLSPYQIAFFEGGPDLSSDALPLVPPPFFNAGIRVSPQFSLSAEPSAIARLNSARVVPEPATLMLLGAGIAGVFGMRRRR